MNDPHMLLDSPRQALIPHTLEGKHLSVIHAFQKKFHVSNYKLIWITFLKGVLFGLLGAWIL